MDLNDLNKVWEIKALKMIGEDEAKSILEKIAKQVQPIMRRRKWKVTVLSEFCPSNPSLMGLNIGGGAEVKLRLRRVNNQWDFFPYEQILDTMLHELCHNAFGPHNSDFYKLLDEIRKECEELMAKGITGTGQGFDRPGRRVGGYFRQPPIPILRQTALAAAENRAKRGTLLPSGPQRLGGDGDIKTALSPIQAAAMAAERRLHDDVWCGSKLPGSSSSTNIEVHVEPRPANSTASSGASTVSSSSRQEVSRGRGGWQCHACTLLNQQMSVRCEACETPRRKEGVKLKIWSCKFCTLENSSEVDRCLACGEWRYSYGQPVSAP
ncbi:DNA-dependent metalloprotease WSS1 [Linum grandiflorum]